MKREIKGQYGFTLIELMIAITLGLLITAAAIQLFITGQSSMNLQKGMADLQESGNFGLRYISNDIRKSNYGNAHIINDRLANGGLVFTTRHTPRRAAADTINTDASVSVNINMHNNQNPPVAVNIPVISYATGPSNVDVMDGTGQSISNGSDQLVIQFYADHDGIDCEGNTYKANRYVIQRYFLREDSNATAEEKKRGSFSLACEAGSYIDASASAILKNPDTSAKVFGTTNGEILIRRVEHLHFLLRQSQLKIRLSS